jgi:SAM-dependent methyltransferase
MTQPRPITAPGEDALAGAAVYSPALLMTYDVMVLGVSNRLAWRCPSAEVLALYNAHVTGNHLDVGVGTGYFLAHCRFPTPHPRLSLLDLNQNSLAHTARRLRRYAPATYVGDVLSPLALPGPAYDSIGVNYLLHCLPKPMARKATAFDHLRPLLAPGGVLFGSTILGRGAGSSAAGRALMRFYNARRIFANEDDSLEALQAALSARFDAVEVRQVGGVALFNARGT